jgi:hypothetical protein
MRIKVLLLAAVVAVVLSGCSLSGSTHQSSPALWTNRLAGNVTQFPSGFRNVGSKCVKVGAEWFAVFSGSSSGADAIAAVPDPSCVNGLGDGR